jgi:hypothetical protein
MDKRGYFFTIDAFIAIGILVIGVVLTYLSYTSNPTVYQQSSISSDLMHLFSTTELSSMNSRYVEEQVASGNITNTANTVFEQLGEFYSIGKFAEAQNMTKALSNNLVPPQYYYSIWLDGLLLYNKSYIGQKTEQVTVSKVMIVGSTNYSSLWGPYEAEVIVWR